MSAFHLNANSWRSSVQGLRFLRSVRQVKYFYLHPKVSKVLDVWALDRGLGHDFHRIGRIPL